ncbi:MULTISPECIES: hypothetical protein [unclassified Sphingomonas]|uniref:hypothetical protein n=1 Tax=unclassified Sphingomonas TaxID=196159 RepID=UPI0021510B7C|nr:MULTISPECIES: hypothetical protein [unclassified Sphingomonas]MCR5869481.1 hypothetical protein [Sphingomonas sp. J344]UUX98792.1 hypothetical protein LRS08_14895 [Sphingomonas sp. J315]
MHKAEAARLHEFLLQEAYCAARNATSHIRAAGSGSMQDEFIRSFATIGGLMKLVADIMADEIVQAPAAEDAILDDVLAVLGMFLAEAKHARIAPVTAGRH